MDSDRVSDKVVVAAMCHDRYEAELLRSLLESAGITAAVETDDAGGFQPQLQATRGVRVMVREGDLVAANEAFAGVDRTGHSDESG